MMELFVVLWQLLILAGAVSMLIVLVTRPVNLMAVLFKLGIVAAWASGHYLAFVVMFFRNYNESGLETPLDLVTIGIFMAIPVVNVVAILSARRALIRNKSLRILESSER